MKLILFTITALLACCYYADAHAGIIQPRPRGNLFCNETALMAWCGQGGAPCGPGNALRPGPVKKVEAEDKITVKVFQRLAHEAKVGNYYALNFWDAAGNMWELKKEQQTNMKDNVILKWDVNVPKDAVKGPALIQVIFNATAAQSDVFYTCSDLDVTDAAVSMSLPLALMAAAASMFAFGF